MPQPETCPEDTTEAAPSAAAATPPAPIQLRPVDRVALSSMHEALIGARASGDGRPPFAILAESLSALGVELPRRPVRSVSLEQARDDWLQRLRSANRRVSSISAYRVALDDLLAYLARSSRDRDPFREETIVAYLDDYRRRTKPADATYYRRFTLLRSFFRWLSRRSSAPDPFLDLTPPRNPRKEADWLTPEEFARLLGAAANPQRRRPGLAERDCLVLLTLVSTGLRRSELLRLNWEDLDLDGKRPSLLVRRAKSGRPRRQPLPPQLRMEFLRRREAVLPRPETPVFCGLGGKRLTTTILATIIRRAAERAHLAKRISAHTLRHTAATWLRQQTGDARLVAGYLGHADLSTVSRYAHVAPDELHAAALHVARRVELSTRDAFPPERRRQLPSDAPRPAAPPAGGLRRSSPAR